MELFAPFPNFASFTDYTHKCKNFQKTAHGLFSYLLTYIHTVLLLFQIDR